MKNLIYVYEDEWEQLKKRQREEMLKTAILGAFILTGSLILAAYSILIRFLTNKTIAAEDFFIIWASSYIGALVFVGIEKLKMTLDEYFDLLSRVRLVPRSLPKSRNIEQAVRENHAGFVYLMASPSASKKVEGIHFTKLGCSKKPQNRIKKIQARKPPFDWELIYAIPADDMYEAEHTIHEIFNHKRARESNKCEFFWLDDKDIDTIKSMTQFRDHQFS